MAGRERFASIASKAIHPMRNDVKPVIPSRQRDPSGGSDFDDARNPSHRRERGNDTDPAGPKRSTTYGSQTRDGAVTDASGTTGPVSHSNDRQSTTTGKLRNPDLERSARMGAAPDVSVYDIPTGDRPAAMPWLLAALVVVVGVLGLITYLSWPDRETDRDEATPRAFDRSVITEDQE
jgi:hypothetical protein